MRQAPTTSGEQQLSNKLRWRSRLVSGYFLAVVFPRVVLQAAADSTFGCSASTCDALDWAPHSTTGTVSSSSSYGGVCGATDEAPLLACSGARPWAWAEQKCLSIGARLCSASELLGGVGQGSGCNYDHFPVWTSDRCSSSVVPNQSESITEDVLWYWATGITNKGVTPACVAATENVTSDGKFVFVRCCADVHASNCTMQPSVSPQPSSLVSESPSPMPTCLLPTLEPSPSSSSISNSDDDTTSGHSGPLVAALASFTINASSAVAGTGQVARLRLAVIDVMVSALGKTSSAADNLLASFEISYDDTAAATNDNSIDDSKNEGYNDDADDFILPENRRRGLSIDGTSLVYRWFVKTMIVALEQDVIATSSVTGVEGAAGVDQRGQMLKKSGGSKFEYSSPELLHLHSLGSTTLTSSSSSSTSLPSADLLATLAFQALSSSLFPATIANRSVGLSPGGDVTAAEAGTHTRALRTITAARSTGSEASILIGSGADLNVPPETAKMTSTPSAGSRALLVDKTALIETPTLSSSRLRLGSMVGSGVFLAAELSDLEPSSVGGLHVHSGTSCATHEAVGGHYLHTSDGASSSGSGVATDPWAAVVWESDAHGVANVVGPDLLNYTLRGSGDAGGGNSRHLPLEGHAVVLHDSYGDRIACGLLADEAPTSFPTPSIIGWKPPTPQPHVGTRLPTVPPTAPLISTLEVYPGYASEVSVDLDSVVVEAWGSGYWNSPTLAPVVPQNPPSPVPSLDLFGAQGSINDDDDEVWGEPATSGLEKANSGGVVGMLAACLVLGVCFVGLSATAWAAHKRRPKKGRSGWRPWLPRFTPALVALSAFNYATSVAFLVALLAAQSIDQRGSLKTDYDPLADDALHALGQSGDDSADTDGIDNSGSNRNTSSSGRKNVSNEFFLGALLTLLLARTIANVVATWHAAAFAVLLKVGQRAPASGQGLDPLALRQRRQLYRLVWSLSATCAFEALALLPWTAPFDQHGNGEEIAKQKKQKDSNGSNNGISLSKRGHAIINKHHGAFNNGELEDDTSSLLLVEADNVCGGVHQTTPNMRYATKNQSGRGAAGRKNNNDADDENGGSEENSDVGCSGSNSSKTSSQSDAICCRGRGGDNDTEGSSGDVEMALARSLQNRNSALASLAHNGTFSSGAPASRNPLSDITGPATSLNNEGSDSKKCSSGDDNDEGDDDEEDDDDDDEGAFLDERGVSSSSMPVSQTSRISRNASGAAAILANVLPFSGSNTALMLPGEVATGGGILPSKWLAACSFFLMVLENVCGIVLQVLYCLESGDGPGSPGSNASFANPLTVLSLVSASGSLLLAAAIERAAYRRRVLGLGADGRAAAAPALAPSATNALV